MKIPKPPREQTPWVVWNPKGNVKNKNQYYSPAAAAKSKKNTKDMRSKTKAARMPRGGFTAPSPVRPMPSSPPRYRNTPKPRPRPGMVSGGGAASFSPSTYRGALTRFLVEMALDAGLKAVANRRRRGKGSQIPFESVNTLTREPSPMSAPVSPNRYRIKIDSGKKPGSALRMLRQMSGEVTEDLFNTERSDFNSSDQSRRNYTQTFGFNERLYFVPNSAHVTREELRSIVSPSTVAELGNNQDKVDSYANVTRFTQEVKVGCENDFYGMKIKIHLVAAKSSTMRSQNENLLPRYAAASPKQMMKVAFNINKGVNSDGAIPLYTQSEILDVEGTNTTHVLCTKEGNIKDSDAFNQEYKIIKTYNRTLDPNDTIYIKHTHHYKSGVYLNSLYATNSSGAALESLAEADESPMFTFFLIEAVGTPATLRRNGVTVVSESNYVGTAIGKLAIEYRKSISFIPTLLTEMVGTLYNPVCSGRTFLKRPEKQEEIYTASYASVVDPTVELSLVATTDTNRQVEGQATPDVLRRQRKTYLEAQVIDEVISNLNEEKEDKLPKENLEK